MTWRRRLARAWVAVVLAACGCTASPSALSALPPNADVARSQKPETTPPRPTPTAACLIGQPVDPPAEASRANPTATICAVVNGEPILDEEVTASCYQQLAAARTPQDRQEIMKQALEAIIDREVLLQEALARLERGGPQGANSSTNSRKRPTKSSRSAGSNRS